MSGNPEGRVTTRDAGRKALKAVIDPALLHPENSH